jgi:hypothetical protein
LTRIPAGEVVMVSGTQVPSYRTKGGTAKRTEGRTPELTCCFLAEPSPAKHTHFGCGIAGQAFPVLAEPAVPALPS